MAAPLATPDQFTDWILRRSREGLKHCRLCGLCEFRSRIVFGNGAPNPDVVVVGDRPGISDDRNGNPFSGIQANIIETVFRSVGIDANNVYFTNLVLCRTPSGRRPTQRERAACESRLRIQINNLNPRVIVALGAAASLFGLRFGDRGFVEEERWGPYWGTRLRAAVVSIHSRDILQSKTKHKKAKLLKEFQRDMNSIVGHINE